MLQCDELIGKVVQAFTLFEDGPDGPEIQVQFTDGTVFHSCLKTSTALEAKLLHNSATRSEVLRDFMPASALRLVVSKPIASVSSPLEPDLP